MTTKAEELEGLDLDELREEAKRRGFIIGETLTRHQILALLLDEDDGEREISPEEQGELFGSMKTVSMAEIYASQGLTAEALKICRDLLARDPDDRRAKSLETKLVSDSGESGIPADAELLALAEPEPRGEMKDLRLERDEPWIEVFEQGEGRFFLSWTCDRTTDKLAAARAGLGAHRVLRCFSLWLDGRLEQATRDEPAAERRSERFVEDVPPGATHRFALGWLGRSGELVSICHTGPVSTARSAHVSSNDLSPADDDSVTEEVDTALLEQLIARAGVEERAEAEPVSDLEERPSQSDDGPPWSRRSRRRGDGRARKRTRRTSAS